MPVSEILLLRHGHRLSWTLNPLTGIYTSTTPYPSGLPADPPLASHGESQSRETATFLSSFLAKQIESDRLRVYSSPFYRCLQTLQPSIERWKAEGWKGEVRVEKGVGEWFGEAAFEQPIPLAVGGLKGRFFGWVDGERVGSLVTPRRGGEGVAEVHERMGRALRGVVLEVEGEYEGVGRGEEEVTVLICGHAAGVIAAGRALTGRTPEDYGEGEFGCFTCGVSRFVRRSGVENGGHGGAVLGQWYCVMNSSCEHLSQGEERGWRFNGEESFDSLAPLLSREAEVEGEDEKVAEGSKL